MPKDLLSRSNLHSWYLAFLRKNLLDDPVVDAFTPRKLISADQEVVKQLIETEARYDLNNELTRSKPRQWLPVFLTFALFSVPVAILHLSSEKSAVFLLACSIMCIFFCYRTLKGKSYLAEDIIVASNKHLNVSPTVVNRKHVSEEEQAWLKVKELLDLIKELDQKESLIFRFCPYLLCQINSKQVIVDLNDSCRNILGYNKSELIGVSIFELAASQSHGALRDVLEQSMSKGQSHHAEIIFKAKNENLVDLLWKVEWSQSLQSFFCIAEDISARKDNERLKTEMTAMINHDLRAPTTALTFWIENMLGGTYGEISLQMEASLKRTDRNLKNIMSLLDNLLDMEQLENGRLEGIASNVRIQEAFNTVGELYADWLQANELRLEVADTSLVVKCDPVQLNRILSNYLSNAIKWSPKGSAISIRAHQEGSVAIIEVEDSGPGIPKEMHDVLFKRWTSLSPLTQKGAASAGLGLFIAGRFAQLQGGNTGYKQPLKGSGSNFWVSLPMHSAS